MAHEVLSVLGFVSKELLTLLREEGKLLGGLRQEVQLISDEFGHMKAFLEVTESRKGNDPRLREWIRQVREVACDTEDVLDEFKSMFAHHRPHGVGFQWSFNSIKNFPARHRLANKLLRIKGRVKNISDARLRYESHYSTIPDQVPGRLSVNNAWRHSKDDDALLAEEAQLVGIDRPRQHLVSQLLEDESPLKVIAVLGMGGLGKTTLVKKVHEYFAVQNHFQIRAWVTVSQTCDFHELLRGFIQQLHDRFKKPVPPALESMDLYQLKALIKDFLQLARYLIVLDDVWDREFWDAFKFVLPGNSYGGNRVILTTRIADVATASSSDSHDYLYKMEFLSLQDSWTLFCRRTFKDSCCPAHLENIVQGIVERCEGLPLAIVAIGGLLASKDLSRTDEWERIRCGLGNEIEGSGKLDGAKKILCLSYNDLPPTLKTCLLYTGIYPEDYKIGYNHLMQLWIAERFVEQGAGLTAEEVAWEFLKELINRSLIRVSEILYDGLPRYCHIHDLIREVIISESREQNMMTIFGTQLTRTGWSSEKMVRRLVFKDNLLDITNHESHPYFCNLRSVISFGRTEPPPKALFKKLLCSKLLKVLDLRGVSLEEIPEEIFDLFHLTYLCISGKRIETVPKSIKRLQNLEYLDLRGTGVKELDKEILKLQKLRHLLVYQQVDSSDKGLGYYGFKAPSKMGGLQELQTLANIDAVEGRKTGIFSEIGKLAKLRKLGVANLRTEDGKELCFSLEKLTNLQALRVGSLMEKDEVITLDLNHSLPPSSLQSLCWLILTGRLEKMPPWVKNLTRLGRINLSWSSLTDDSLESLQHLPNLIEISLSHQAYQGESLCFKTGGFLKLKKLYLKNMKGLRWMRIEEGAMPSIKSLILEQLPLLEELPNGIENLSQLQKLELWDLSARLTKKLQNEASFAEAEAGEVYREIQHIPQVLINGFQRDPGWNKKTEGKQTLDTVLVARPSSGLRPGSAFPSSPLLIVKLCILLLVFFIFLYFYMSKGRGL